MKPEAMSDKAELPWQKRAFYLLAAFLLTALIAVFGLDILVRVIAPQPGNMRWLVPDARYGHVMRADADEHYAFAGTDFVMEVKTNSLGLRDKELKPRLKNEPTVVFMGDSVTFGHGLNVDQRFDTLLGSMIAQAGLSFRLINTGVNAWGTLQETRWVSDHFKILEPDIIVLTFTGNDPSDDAYFLKKGQSFDVVRFPGKRWLRDHSHLYRLVTHYAFVVYHSFAVSRQSRTEPDAPIDRQSGSVITEAEWNSTKEILRSFRDEFRAYNPNSVILIQPAAPKENHIAAHLRAFADELGFVFIDMAPRVRDVPAEDLRLPYDGHWSPRMHAISAEAIFDALKRLAGPSTGQNP